MTASERNETSLCLEKNFVWLREHCAAYMLFAKAEDGETTRFCMQVSMEGESAALFLGYRLDFALQMFRRMVRGSVPPCALAEVFADVMHALSTEEPAEEDGKTDGSLQACLFY